MRIKFLTESTECTEKCRSFLKGISVLSATPSRSPLRRIEVRVAFLFFFVSTSALAQSVGDIAFDPKTDDPHFKLCRADWVWQGYSLKTMMDETPLTVDREFRSKFISKSEWRSENGIIRIRFIVNCNGAADRFRFLELDFDLRQKQFSDDIRSHVLKISKEIKWPVRRAQQQTVDYYHYFSIRIVEGKLTDIIQ